MLVPQTQGVTKLMNNEVLSVCSVVVTQIKVQLAGVLIDVVSYCALITTIFYNLIICRKNERERERERAREREGGGGGGAERNDAEHNITIMIHNYYRIAWSYC